MSSFGSVIYLTAGHVPKLLDRHSIKHNIMGRGHVYRKIRDFMVGWAFSVDIHVVLVDIHYH